MSEKEETEKNIPSSVPKVKDEPLSDDDIICDSPFVKKDANVTVKAEPVDESDGKMKITVKATDEKHAIEIKKDATTKEVRFWRFRNIF